MRKRTSNKTLLIGGVAAAADRHVSLAPGGVTRIERPPATAGEHLDPGVRVRVLNGDIPLRVRLLFVVLLDDDIPLRIARGDAHRAEEHRSRGRKMHAIAALCVL